MDGELRGVRGRLAKKTGSHADKQRGNSQDEDATGLLNEGYRYRDLESGVWLSRDPAGFVDGPNVYAYVRQNPWSHFDAHGLFLKKLRALGKLDDVMKQVVRKGAGKDGRAIVGGRNVSMPEGLKPGQTHILDDAALAKKYPSGVQFDKDGFPDFSPYRQRPDVKIDMQGNHTTDFSEADKLSGITAQYRKDNGLTWHHHQDGTTMQLVPKDLHGNTAHTGGVAVVQAAKDVATKAGLFAAEVLAPNTTKAYLAGGAGVLGYSKAALADVGESMDPGIGMIATRENAEKAGRGFWNAVDGSGNYGDYSHSYKPSMWESFKGSLKGAWDFCTGADLKK